MKTDTELRADVLEELRSHPIDDSNAARRQHQGSAALSIRLHSTVPSPGVAMRTLILSCLLLSAVAATAQPAATSRGALLYTTHCIECHTSQMHWRTQRLARDWGSLRAQVWRWQREVRLDWREDDVDAVTSYLNETIYQFPRRQALAPARVGPILDGS